MLKPPLSLQNKTHPVPIEEEAEWTKCGDKNSKLSKLQTKNFKTY
jgi:hypothetical protein